MIKVEHGRARSYRTGEELERQLKKEMELLTPDERATLEIMLKEMAHAKESPMPRGTPLLEAFGNAEFKQRPVDIETFISDPYFLGETCNNLFPVLREDLKEMFSGNYHEIILTGCIELDALIQSSNGAINTIRDWIGTSGSVLGFHPAGGVHVKTGLAKHSGIMPTLQLKLANGMAQKLTPNHPVMTWRDGYKWVPASELTLDDLVVVPRSIATKPDSDLSIEEAKLLAYWCTDGSSSEQRSRFTDGNPETSLEVMELLAKVGFSGERYPIGPKCWEVYVHSHKRTGFLEWLRSHEGHHKTASVLVPDSVCRATNKVVAAFINRVWAAEGCVYANPGKSPSRFTLGMTSERFIRQMQLLLLRFGVQSRIYFTPQFDKRSGKTSKMWILTVTGVGPLTKMLREIGPILGKESKCSEIAAHVYSKVANTNVDIVPIVRNWLSLEMTRRGIKRHVGSKWWRLAQGSGKYLSRDMFDLWLLEFGTTELGVELKARFPDSYGFEAVVERTEAGITEVGDICDVEGVNSFVSNGIYSHNSIGYGKTHLATIGVCRVLYEMSCLKSPHKTFGLAKGSNIAIVCTSVNEALAVKVAFEGIATKLQESLYFQKVFPFEDTKKEMRFPEGIWVAARASTDTSALGLNAIGGLMDECLHPDSMVLLADGTESKISDLAPLKHVVVATFDFAANEPVSALAHIKESTPQICYEVKLSNGQVLRASWNHPVAVQERDGLKFISVCDLQEGAEVVTHAPVEARPRKGSTQQEIVGSYSPAADRQESHLPDLRGDGTKREDGTTVTLGVEGSGIVGSGSDGRDLSLRELCAALPLAGEGQTDVARLQSADEGWQSAYMRSKAGELLGKPARDNQNRRRSELLQGARLGVRALGRTLSVAKVLSKTQVGVCPTYDVSVPGYEVFIADGTLVHNTNFLPKTGKNSSAGVTDRADTLYNLIKGRMKSRFTKQGKLPGMLFVVSSKKTTDDFTERLVKEAREKQDPTVFVRDYAMWETRPADMYLPTKFWVLCGNESLPSKVLTDQEYADIDQSKLPEDVTLVHVPDDFRSDFDRDLERCLTRDTEIALLDGTSAKIADLVGRENFWVYSYGADGRMYPGKGHSARLTQKNAPILEVTLDTGTKIRCTANHPFMLRNGSYCAAGDLTDGTSLMPIYRRLSSGGYELIKSNVEGKDWVATHRIIAREAHNNGVKLPKNRVVHHKDTDRRNNTPDNLVLLTVEEHTAIHTSRLPMTLHKPEVWAKAAESRRIKAETDPAYKERLTQQLKDSGYAGSDANKARNKEALAARALKTCHTRWKHPGELASCPICLKKESPFNHKVVSVVPCGFEDVYDITVDTYHNFALTAGVVVHNSIRDIAGISTVSVNPFINRREKLLEAVHPSLRHPFSTLVYDASKGGRFLWENMIERTVERGMGDTPFPVERPILNPRAQRHIHIDASLRQDKTGFAMVHIGGWKNVARRSEDGREFLERAPIYVVDLVLQIVPPPGDEIILADLHHLVYDLSAHGYTITSVSMDSYQSAGSLQEFNRRGFNATLQSADKTMAPYENLKTAFYENRINMYNYPPLIKELEQLEKHYNNGRVKVDHPPSGCFTGDTRIALLDGSLPTFEELAKRYPAGEVFYVYSMSPEGICVGEAHNPRITKVASSIVEVMLDNFQVIRCTPEHLFMTLHGEWVQAENITSDTSLMPLYRSRENKGGWGGYERAWCPIQRKRILTHQLVASQFHGVIADKHVHHINSIRHDNSPSNLVIKSLAEHFRDHTLERHQDPDYVAKLREGHKKYRENGGNEKSRQNILRLYAEGKLHRREKCSIEGCDILQNAKGLCDMHYQRMRRAKIKGERSSTQKNHRVISIKHVEQPVEVWDITVEKTENFALASGVFVHNSKDISDALASCCFTLMTQQSEAPLPVMKGITYSSEAWMEERRQSILNGGAGAKSPLLPLGVLPPVMGRGNGGGWDPEGGGGWNNM